MGSNARTRELAREIEFRMRQQSVAQAQKEKRIAAARRPGAYPFFDESALIPAKAMREPARPRWWADPIDPRRPPDPSQPLADWLRAVVARVQMRNSPIPMTFTIAADCPCHVQLRIMFSVRDRTTGDPLTLFFSHTEPPEKFAARDEAKVLDWLHGHVRWIFRHELEECWHVDGVRVHDPHQTFGGHGQQPEDRV